MTQITHHLSNLNLNLPNGRTYAFNSMHAPLLTPPLNTNTNMQSIQNFSTEFPVFDALSSTDSSRVTDKPFLIGHPKAEKALNTFLLTTGYIMLFLIGLFAT